MLKLHGLIRAKLDLLLEFLHLFFLLLKCPVELLIDENVVLIRVLQSGDFLLQNLHRFLQIFHLRIFLKLGAFLFGGLSCSDLVLKNGDFLSQFSEPLVLLEPSHHTLQLFAHLPVLLSQEMVFVPQFQVFRGHI